jgi:hypothetical protein
MVFGIRKRDCVIGLLISVRDHTPMRVGKYRLFENKFATGTASADESKRFVAAVFSVVNRCWGTLHGWRNNFSGVANTQWALVFGG